MLTKILDINLQDDLTIVWKILKQIILDYQKIKKEN